MALKTSKKDFLKAVVFKEQSERAVRTIGALLHAQEGKLPVGLVDMAKEEQAELFQAIDAKIEKRCNDLLRGIRNAVEVYGICSNTQTIKLEFNSGRDAWRIVVRFQAMDEADFKSLAAMLSSKLRDLGWNVGYCHRTKKTPTGKLTGIKFTLF